jgi:diguanylate cyclase (GGDEF)-like protein/PAS domain S-box-containing protein
MVRKESPLLVVDDEPTNREMLSRRLQRAGYLVEMAADADQALALIQNREIELVLLDSMMPGMNGLELLRLLRGAYSPARLPVIMVTALKESEKIIEAMNLGANDYITKPIDFPVALARIKSQLNRKRAEDALRESEERYALAARGAKDGLWDWDLQEDRVYFSPRWKAMLGYEDSEIGDSPDEWLSRIHKEDRGRLRSELAAHWEANAEGELVSEHRMLHKDGSYRWMLSRGVVLRSKGGKAVRMAGSQTDITQSKAFDPLTGLPNRLMFNESLTRVIERSQQEPANLFAVLFLDLDRFKVVNDSLGHLVGDQLLIGIAKRLQFAVRSRRSGRAGEEDIIARLGGDEFAILLENLSHFSNAKTVAERIQKEIHKPFNLEGREVFTTMSIGIAPGDAQYQTPAEILRDADTAMYRAKSLGKARCEVFDAEMRADAIARLEMENDLQRALGRREFVLHYQPKVKLQDGKLVGFEALLRWQHPTRGLISPTRFIPLAEETGLIVPIGLWVLREACSTMHQWHSKFPTNPPLEISVNLSMRQFRQQDLVDQIAQILKETGLEPSALQLEITESVLMDDTDSALSVLERIKALNVGLKIDDFGTGYSSLNYLHQLPFDSLKIDRSFVVSLGHDETCSEVVKAIMSLAGNLGMHVIAEGVETHEQVTHLLKLGCRYAQGFYFSKPVDAHAAKSLLTGPSLSGADSPTNR